MLRDVTDLKSAAAEPRPAGIVGQVIDPDVIVGDQDVQRRALAGVELDGIDVLGHCVGAGERLRPVLFDHHHGRVSAARHDPGGDVHDPLRGQRGLTVVQQHLDERCEHGR
ncbi:MAG: hypothetical protein JO287_20890 [Pseudonocardiales bacterium]|nr:hypothetical protein [Pseudonocardiales bacterium]